MADIAIDQLADVKTEWACIGAVILEPSLYALTDLKVEDFFFLGARHAWAAIGELIQAGDDVNVLTVAHQIKLKEGVDTLDTLTRSFEHVPHADHLHTYVQTVKGYSVRRQILTKADEMKAAALNHANDADMLVGLWSTTGAGITSPTPRTLSFGEMIAQRMGRAEYLVANPDIPAGIPYGLSELDGVTSGMHNSDLVILAGRPGMGKTAAMLSWLLHQAKAGYRVGMFSLEMSWESLIDRLVSMESGVSSQRTRNPQLMTSDDFRNYTAAMGKLHKLKDNIVLDDRPGLTLQQMITKASLWNLGGLDVLYCDYLQIMGRTSSGKFENRTQEVGEFARGMKRLAREMNVPVVVGSQLSRALESRADKHPLLSDLRESGEIEQEADIVIGLYRDVCYNVDTEFPNEAEFIILKHRNGPLSTARAYYEANLTKFLNGTKRTFTTKEGGIPI